MFRTSTSAAVLALSLCTANAGPAVSVRFGDLDLSRPGDRQVLDSRIRQAAETRCASLNGLGTHIFFNAWFDNCVTYGVKDTRARIMALSSDKYRAVASK